MKRIEWLDDIKGVAIALVVAGHIVATMRNMTTGCVQFAMQVAFDCIYSFHIPLFFVLAGLTFSADKKFVEFFRRKFFRLMVPYYIWGVAGALLALVLGQSISADIQAVATTSHFAHKTVNGAWFVPFLSIIHGGGWPNGNGFWFNGVLWFLPVMFIVELIYYWIAKFAKDKASIFFVFAVSWLFLLYWSPMVCQLSGVKGIYLPFNLVWIPKYLPFIALGHWFSLIFLRNDVDGGKWYYRWLSCAVFVCIATIYVCPCLGMVRWDRPDINLSVYYIEWFLKAFLGISVVMILAKFKAFRIFAFFAPMSLGIMLFHKYPLVVAQVIIGRMKLAFLNEPWFVTILSILLTFGLTFICYYASKLVLRFAPWSLGVKCNRQC